MSESIVEHWQSDTALDKARETILAMSRFAPDEAVMDSEVEVAPVKPSPDAKSIDLLCCLSALPHVDLYFPEWSALWVLRHAEGHAVHVSDRKARKTNHALRKPPRATAQVVPVALGQVILLNVHRIHWMPLPKGRTRFVAASFEFAARPTRDEVDARIREEAGRFRAPVP